MLKKFFSADITYKKMTEDYTKRDSFLAVGLYLFVILSYLGMGILQNLRGIYLGIPVNLFLVFVCIMMVLVRKQPLASIGLSVKNLKKSFLLGLGTGVFVLLIFVVPGIFEGGKLIGFESLVKSIFYYFFVIGLPEEILFRGYIQTRLYGVIKSDVLAVIAGGVMFMSMHIPYQIYVRGGSFIDFIVNNCIWLLITFVWHFMFNFLYRKYNALAASTIFHTLINLSNDLLR